MHPRINQALALIRQAIIEVRRQTDRLQVNIQETRRIARLTRERQPERKQPRER